MNFDKPIVILDIETTGLSIATDRIIKLDLFKHDEFPTYVTTHPPHFGYFKTYLINPGKEISQEAYEIHGISNDTLKDEPRFEEIVEELKDSIDGCVLTGYNIKRFDLPLLIEEFYRAGSPLSLDSVDILDLKEIYSDKEPRTLVGAHKHYVNWYGKEKSDVNMMCDILVAQLNKYSAELPKSISELGQYYTNPKTLDFAGKVVTNDSNKPCFSFGKYVGKTLNYIKNNDPSYITWVLNSENFTEDTKNIIRKYSEEDE